MNGHGGDIWRAAEEAGRDPDSLLDVSANLHPWGPPPGVREAAARSLARLGRYPPPHAEPLRDALSARLGAPVIVGNGATELLVAALAGPPGGPIRQARLRAPSYLGYAEAAALAGARVAWGAPTAEDDVIVVGRPNNPDGACPTVAEVAALAATFPSARIVVDESFLAFTEAPSCIGLAPNVVVVASLTKTFAIPGLRLGWAWNLPAARLPPWTVNVVALEAGLACLDVWDWPRRAPIDAWRAALVASLGALPGVAQVTGGANFVLVTLAAPFGPTIRGHALRDAGVLVRDASNFAGLDERHLRVAVRTPEENVRTVAALAGALDRVLHVPTMSA